jgi:hypothetical protein
LIPLNQNGAVASTKDIPSVQFQLFSDHFTISGSTGPAGTVLLVGAIEHF